MVCKLSFSLIYQGERPFPKQLQSLFHYLPLNSRVSFTIVMLFKSFLWRNRRKYLLIKRGAFWLVAPVFGNPVQFEKKNLPIEVVAHPYFSSSHGLENSYPSLKSTEQNSAVSRFNSAVFRRGAYVNRAWLRQGDWLLAANLKKTSPLNSSSCGTVACLNGTLKGVLFLTWNLFLLVCFLFNPLIATNAIWRDD